nr:hypothetical protein [Tanacetum cinerariifolium]GEY62597.1 hypothetical protein [Tanacetum cinerariifolium]
MKESRMDIDWDKVRRKFKFSMSKALASKSKASASKLKVSTSAASKSKASTLKTLKVSTSKPLTSSGYSKIAMTRCVFFLRAQDAPIEQLPFPRDTKAAYMRSCSRKRRPK